MAEGWLCSPSRVLTMCRMSLQLLSGAPLIYHLFWNLLNVLCDFLLWTITGNAVLLNHILFTRTDGSLVLLTFLLLNEWLLNMLNDFVCIFICISNMQYVGFVNIMLPFIVCFCYLYYVFVFCRPSLIMFIGFASVSRICYPVSFCSYVVSLFSLRMYPVVFTKFKCNRSPGFSISHIIGNLLLFIWLFILYFSDVRNSSV